MGNWKLHLLLMARQGCSNYWVSGSGLTECYSLLWKKVSSPMLILKNMNCVAKVSKDY